MKINRSFCRQLALGAALIGISIGAAQAERVKFEATIASKADVSHEFIDGSQHVVRLVQREGPLKGEGPLSGATLLEWGMHDLTPGVGGEGVGYLIVTKAPGDVAYLKFQWTITAGVHPDGKVEYLMGGFWQVVGSAGKLKGLSGLGTMRIGILKGTERHWMFEGDLMQYTKPNPS